MGAVIEGVETRVVHDRAFEKDVLSEKYVMVEDTFDWHAQDDAGTVWYFGEDTKELDADGNIVSTKGSWEAGVDGAKAGFIMLADPQVGLRYYQELFRNVAEDQAKVLSLNETVTLNVNGKDVTFENVLLTQETSRLDPGVLEYKYYARGVGLIRKRDREGRERVHGAGPNRALQLRPQFRSVLIGSAAPYGDSGLEAPQGIRRLIGLPDRCHQPPTVRCGTSFRRRACGCRTTPLLPIFRRPAGDLPSSTRPAPRQPRLTNSLAQETPVREPGSLGTASRTSARVRGPIEPIC